MKHRFKALIVADDLYEGSSAQTIDVIVPEDDPCIATGLVDLHGNRLYRRHENVPCGFHHGGKQ